MRLLLDTHILIWALSAPERLSAATRQDLADRRNSIFFSAASIWEIAIKASLRRADFVVDPDTLLEEAVYVGFVELTISSHMAAGVKDMPMIHQDPFDRLLIAQALRETCVLLTADSKLAAYSDLVRLV